MKLAMKELKQVSEKMETIKPGMTRWDLQKVPRKAHHDERSGLGADLHKYYENHSSAKTVHI
jgi:hypothetical protein